MGRVKHIVRVIKSGFARILKASRRQFHRKRVLYSTVTILTVVALLAGTLLPMAQVHAQQTLTWTANGDFSNNKQGVCQPTSLDGVVISGATYSDPTCAATGVDASLSLQGGQPTHLTGVSKVSTGETHSLALKADGTVWAWGANSFGQLGNNSTTDSITPVQVKDGAGTGFLSGIIAVNAEQYFSVALKNDGTVWAWGYNFSYQLGDGTNTQRNLPVQVKDPAGTGNLTGITSISTSYTGGIAVKNGGTLWAWGSNFYGTFGNNSTTSSSLPVQVKDPTGTGFMSSVKTVALSANHVIVVKTDGTVWAWGYNSSGQIGDNTTTQRLLPVQVKDAAGTGFLTGVNVVANGTTSPLEGALGYSTAVKTDGTVWAWGENSFGELGDNSGVASRRLPAQVKDAAGTGYLSGMTFVAAGNGSILTIRTDGSVWAWGKNDTGQLGNGTTYARVLPIQVKDSTGSGFLTGVTNVDINIGPDATTTSIAVMPDGSLQGWGSNSYGAIGYQQNGDKSLLPQVVATAYRVTRFDHASAISAGAIHTLALKDDGTVWSWGYNGDGELGDNTQLNRLLPVQVKDPSGTGFLVSVKQVVAGDMIGDGSMYGASYALKTDGTVWAWGNNQSGQIGDNTFTQRLLPVQVKDPAGTGFLTNVKQIASAGMTVIAVKNDGTVWAWGNNQSGQIGDNTVTTRKLPVQVKDVAGTGFLTNVKSLSASFFDYTFGEGGEYWYGSSLAVKNDGTVWAWGDNSYGQLGDNTTTQRNLPIQVKDSAGTGFLSGISSASISEEHSVAVKTTDGSVWTWGENYYGELGNNTTTASHLPVQMKNSSGAGFLTGVATVSVGFGRTFMLLSDGTVLGVGENYSKQLSDGTTTSRSLPVQVKNADGSTLTGIASLSMPTQQSTQSQFAVKSNQGAIVWGPTANGTSGQGYSNSSAGLPSSILSSIQYDTAYRTNGTVTGMRVDAGLGHRMQWNGINWNSAALPGSTSISFAVRTSADGTNWSSWTAEAVQSASDSTTGSADLSALPYSRYLDIRITMQSSGGVDTPTLYDYSLGYLNDITTPPTNASAILATKGSAGINITAGNWSNVAPYFSWTSGQDETNGSGIRGYCLYLGQDNTANPATTKGLLGTSPLAVDGACQYATSSTQLDTTAVGVLSSALTSSNQPYYLLIKAIDNAGNIYNGSAQSFAFKYDNTPPANPSFISAPAGFVASKNVTLTWPNTGTDSPSDANSGLIGLQYRIGTTGIWYGDSHTGTQDATDILINDGSYMLNPAVDYPNIHEGNNTIYFRTIDVAGNVSTTYTTAAIKINTASPSSPQNVVATPSTNTTNSFAFSWQAPSTFVGQASALSYCYTINTLPSEATCAFTTQTSLSADAFATQPGSNTMYVVARDESDNINYDTYSSVTFTANTSAPGVPVTPEIADISTKATSSWKLAISWNVPDDTGAGVSRYQIYRSNDGTTFAQVATTTGLSYVDSALTQQKYYYKVRACDSANNCGAYSTIINDTPTGRFTTPPVLVINPSVETSTKKANFYWVTDRNSDSRIQYGTSSGNYFPGEVTVTQPTKVHNIDLSNLEAGTTYYYRVKWTDEDGNTGISSEFSFTTLPAPVIKDVSIVKTTLNSAIIRFTSTDAVKVSLYYGHGDGFGGLKSINTSSSVSTYDIQLDGLDDGTTYSYKLTTFDSDGNEYDSHRVDTFVTPPRPHISNLRFQPVDGVPTSTQRVTWTTNVPSTSVITYGLDGTNGRDLYTAKLTTDHSMTVSDLEDNSSYFLVAQGQDIDGNLAVSDRQTFKTSLDTRPPKISDTHVETSVKGNGGQARGQVIVSWTTDEPSSSQVAYSTGGSGTSYTSRTVEDTRLSTDHVVIISDLPVSTVYHLQPISRDKAQNEATGGDQSAIIGRGTDSILDVILNSIYKVFGI